VVDVEQIRRDAEQILDSPDLYRIHGFASDVLDLLADVNLVAALVEAMRKADGFLADPEGSLGDSLNLAHNTLHNALAAWESKA
jgi:hypothetical protein